MARERIENGAVTSLNGFINNSVTTVTVTDVTVFSASPQFRVIINSEIMLVTGISGNDLTVVRGSEGSLASGHNDGSTIAQIITREGIRQLQRDWNNPVFDVSTAIPHQLLDDAGAVLDSTDFTDINFAGSGTTTKADMSQGSILVNKLAQTSGSNFGLMVKSAPTAPWVWTVGMIPNLLAVTTADFPSCGVCVRENATGEFYHFQQSAIAVSCRVKVDKFASVTASATAFLAGDTWSGPYGATWFQVEDDNTDLIFRISADGINFIEVGREARLTFLTPDEIGISINNDANAIPIQTTLVAWDES